MPTRTCAACRGPADQRDLLRLVWQADRVAVDPRAVLPGRGVYLHDTEACWQLAIRKRVVGRALRLTPEQTGAARLDELAATRLGSPSTPG
jgi:predicted RNA-binding protein YlxR (DUF448 family)